MESQVNTMSDLDDVKRKWLADLAGLVGGAQAPAQPRDTDQGAGGLGLLGLAGLGGTVGAKAAPDGGSAASFAPFAPSPSDLITNPYGPDSVFSIPTTPVAPAAPSAPAKVSVDMPLDSAISAWTEANSRMTTNLGQLESAILAAFMGEAPTLFADLQKKVTRLSGFAKVFDPSLADALNKAKSAVDPVRRDKALVAARTILVKFRNHLKSQEKLLAQIDTNPFGVKMNLKQEISSSLDQVSKAIH
jgi:hypothetical protein